MTHHDDDQLAAWLADGPQHGPMNVLEDALARARGTGQRPGWLVNMTGGTIAQPGDSLLRYAMVAVAVVALLALLVGALIVGGVLPPPNPRPSILVDNTADPSASPPAGLVAYTVTEELQPGEGSCSEDGPRSFCSVSHIEIANQDGSNAHTLRVDDDPVGGALAGWSPDGSSLLLAGDGILIVDPSGSVLQSFTRDELCRYPCAGLEPSTISPDGRRVAFVRYYPDEDNSSVIAILDLTSGEVVEMRSTRTTNPSIDVRCVRGTRCDGQNDAPRWSPDGNRLAFARQGMSPEPGSTSKTAVFVVNADGTGFHRVTPPGIDGIDPSWSPDGTALVFLRVTLRTQDGNEELPDLTDIYFVLPDGSGLRRLTEDEVSIRPDWTVDGRVNFVRTIGAPDSGQYENWIMDADGGNPTMLGTSLAELTAAGCVVCPYPLPGSSVPLNDGFWPPRP
jgi:hypothetical protein